MNVKQTNTVVSTSGCKRLTEKNTLAFYTTELITGLMIQDPDVVVIKLYKMYLTLKKNNLVRSF